MGSYVPSTPAQWQEMLEAIGLHDFRQLYRDVPEEMLLRTAGSCRRAWSELEVSRTMTAMRPGTSPTPPFSGAPEPMTTTFPRW